MAKKILVVDHILYTKYCSLTRYLTKKIEKFNYITKVNVCNITKFLYLF